MIKVNEQVEVSASPRFVWDLLSDPRAVADCVPGAALGEQKEDGSFDASITIKFGPAKVAFHANVALELDAAAMVGNVITKGKDKQGGTRFRATMNFRVVAQDLAAGSTIPIVAEVEVGGRLAPGRRLVGARLAHAHRLPRRL